ncbi:MAG: amino acid ABC transporter permease [Candidatus Tectomicrobia bacterium]|nr:amino acid ABC transporter permease [Candidatus Tectomicrobia bacterium]
MAEAILGRLAAAARKARRREWFETPRERRAFLLVWGGAAALLGWHFFFGPRAQLDYNWRWELVWEYRRFLLLGIGTTMYIFAWSLVFSLVLGVFCGVGRTTNVRWVRALSAGYVEVFRNIPLLVQMWWAYFGLQEIINGALNGPFGLHILVPSTFACILALTLYTGAYMGEVVRSGIRSVHKGQWEAATSTGLSRFQTWRHVILPQALVIVIPPMASEVLNIIKNSAIAMTIAITDLMFFSQKIEEETFAGFEAYTAGTLLFLLLTLLAVAAIYFLQWLSGLKVRSGH